MSFWEIRVNLTYPDYGSTSRLISSPERAPYGINLYSRYEVRGETQLSDRLSPQNSSNSRRPSPYKPLLSRKESTTPVRQKYSEFSEQRLTPPPVSLAFKALQNAGVVPSTRPQESTTAPFQLPTIGQNNSTSTFQGHRFQSPPPALGRQDPRQLQMGSPSTVAPNPLPGTQVSAFPQSTAQPKMQPAAGSLLESLKRETFHLKRKVQTCIEEYQQTKELNRLLLKKIYILSEIPNK